MTDLSSIDSIPGSVMICAQDGTILEMNARAAIQYKKDGGLDLIGKNVLDCHPEPSRTKLQRLLDTHEINAYTIEKNGSWKLIYQSPWYKDGQPEGIIEISLEIPPELPHFKRD
jgi:hypothetical protein